MSRIQRFLRAVGRHWLRLSIGAVLGLCVTTVLLIDLLIALESQRVSYDFADTYASSALTLLMFGCVGGALYAYARRQPMGGSNAHSGVDGGLAGGRVHAPDGGVRSGSRGSADAGAQDVQHAAASQDGQRPSDGLVPEPAQELGRTTGDVGLDAALDVVARARLNDELTGHSLDALYER